MTPIIGLILSVSLLLLQVRKLRLIKEEQQLMKSIKNKAQEPEMCVKNKMKEMRKAKIRTMIRANMLKTT